MNSLFTYLNARIDKVCHFLAGFMFGIMLIKALSYFYLPLYYAVVVVCAVGVLKEFYDDTCRNSPFDIWDAGWTCLGGILVWLVWAL